MAVEKKIVVVIEFGSSKIRGIAGYKNIDGSIQVLDIEQMSARNCIRKGVVYNLEKTKLCLRNIIDKMEAELDMTITKAYVGLCGKSMRTKKNVVSRQFAAKTLISQEIVDALQADNKKASYPGYEILAVVPQEYRVGIDSTTDPVGVLSSQIEGTFLNVIARTEQKEYVRKCVEASGIAIAGMFVSPMVEAECVLTETEKRSGCALVDFGAGTTTVSIYKNNLLRHLAVIPLGGDNITQDLCSLQVEEDEAEDLKVKYGTAFSEQSREELAQSLLVNNGRPIEERVLIDIVEARMEEILSNVAAQIRNSGYQDKLVAGMVASGGSSNIRNIEKAVADRVGLDKTRLVRIVPAEVRAGHPEQIQKDGTLNILLALLNEGTQNCVQPKVDEASAGVSDTDMAATETGELDEKPMSPVHGEVLPDSGEDVSQEEHPEEKEPKGPKMGGKLKKWLQKITETITADE